MSCARGGCVQLVREAELLEAPYPRGYPSSNPRPNRVVRTLPPGRYQYVSTETGHDFMVYQIRIDSAVGFVVSDDATGSCR